MPWPFSKLVTFGDSWAYGTELPDGSRTFGQLLADRWDCEFRNYAQDGASNDHMLWQLQKYHQDHGSATQTLAVFFITSPWRSCVIDYDGNPVAIYPWADQSLGDRNYYYFKYFHTPEQERFRFQSTVAALQRTSERLGLQDYYIVGWSDCDFQHPGIDQDRIYAAGQKTCADLFGAPSQHEFSLASDNPYVYPNQNHPNQKGHELIAEVLHEWINSRIIKD